MTDILQPLPNTPQCQYFVVRKKRLCRMTVRPGQQYCGEHEPQPKTVENKEDTRIPCPYDPKHTCYASKLEKHLSICNARQGEVPVHIVHNMNAPAPTDDLVRVLLGEVPRETLLQVIDKVNLLYEKHIQGNISKIPEQAIHTAMLEEFSDESRTESSRRHIRQASSLLQLAEDEGLVQDGSCYVELGAGKGKLSYYMGRAWCGPASRSRVLVVDRAALRHKRDNKLRARVSRLRADLAHLDLARVEEVARCGGVVGFAKHLCGVATDYALRCVTAAGVAHKTRGVLLASCCHHRCERAAYVANTQLQELGISGDELNIMLGIVSWATCGDGRSRERRRLDVAQHDTEKLLQGQDNEEKLLEHRNNEEKLLEYQNNGEKLLEHQNNEEKLVEYQNNGEKLLEHQNNEEKLVEYQNNGEKLLEHQNNEEKLLEHQNNGEKLLEHQNNEEKLINEKGDTDHTSDVHDNQKWRQGELARRAEAGRRAKALLDWGRVLFLRERGFDARLCHYVPAGVSLENVCIVATRHAQYT